MLLDNPAHVRTVQSIARMSDEQVYRLYHRMVREFESLISATLRQSRGEGD
jgi:transposase-like protein